MDLWEDIYKRIDVLQRPSLVLAIGTLLAIICVRAICSRRRSTFPALGKVTDNDYRGAMLEGIEKYPNSPFTINGDPPIVILPKSSIEQIKTIKEQELSFNKPLDEEFQSSFTNIDKGRDLMILVVKNDLTRHVASTLKFLQEEIVYALDKELGPCEDWTPFTLYPTVAKIVSLLSARIFVGRPLSRNEEWVAVSINYTFQLILVRNALKKWPLWSRKFVGPFLKEVRQLAKLRERGTELIQPLIDMQLSKAGNEKLFSQDGEELGNVISWLLARSQKNEVKDARIIAIQQLNITFAAIHTTTFTVTQAILDLAAYPEYAQILLDEIDVVSNEDGYDTTENGTAILPKSSIPRLAKLDSFIKESQRINPLGILSHSREVLSEITLNTGHKIPAGTRVAIPSYAIHNGSSALHSPGVTRPLSEFDGLRFYKLRQFAGNESRHQFVSTSDDSLAFGHGIHACPGRFFASNEIKVVLIELLQNWDLRFPDDLKREGGIWRRPKSMFYKFECLPSRDAKVEFRRKEKAAS